LRPNCQIVVCTNLQQLPAKFFDICNKFDLQISSSLDGPPEIHDQNRNQNKNSTASFFENLSACIDALGPKRVNLLPTISEFGIMEDIARTYIELGLNEIFLRPVNYQGFARKKHKNSQSVSENWLTHYIAFLKWLFEFNERSDNQLIETNFSIHLKRIFEPNFNNHVDFRNPNPVGQDYIVVNFDGRIFPTDEARMLERIGIIDLSIGNLEDGIDLHKVEELNNIAKLDNFEACNRCAYKPFCGVDIVDLISKEGTLNVDMLETDHCKIHMSVFDFIFTQITSNTAIFRKNMNLHLTGQYSDTHLLIGSTYD
jgi:radical SAM protein with 4Fe4S-binding SPASM domain